MRTASFLVFTFIKEGLKNTKEKSTADASKKIKTNDYHGLESSSSSISSLFKNVVKQQQKSHCCHRLFDAVGRTLPSGLPVPIFYSY